jgi:hypothetical protein
MVASRAKGIVRVRRPVMVGFCRVRWQARMVRMIEAVWQIDMEGKGSGRCEASVRSLEDGRRVCVRVGARVSGDSGRIRRTERRGTRIQGHTKDEWQDQGGRRDRAQQWNWSSRTYSGNGNGQAFGVLH